MKNNGRSKGPSDGLRVGTRKGSRAPSKKAARISAPSGPALPRHLAPRKAPLQERAQATVEAVLEAASSLFASSGYARTNTNQIAKRAGISIGSLYQYFPNKDAILTSLLDRHLRAVEATIRVCFPLLADSSVPLRESIRNLLVKLLELHESDPQLTRAVEEQVGQMPRVPEIFRQYEEGYRTELERILKNRPDVRPGPHPLMANLLFETAETVSGFLAHGCTEHFDRDTALSEATELLCRYVERRD